MELFCPKGEEKGRRAFPCQLPLTCPRSSWADPPGTPSSSTHRSTQEEPGGTQGSWALGAWTWLTLRLPGYPNRQPPWLRCSQPYTASWFPPTRLRVSCCSSDTCHISSWPRIQSKLIMRSWNPLWCSPTSTASLTTPAAAWPACSRLLGPVMHTGNTLCSNALPFPSQVTFQCLVQVAGGCILSSLIERIATSFDS